MGGTAFYCRHADDTTLSLSSDMTNGLTAMSSALQQDLDDVSRWSAANGYKRCKDEMSPCYRETYAMQA